MSTSAQPLNSIYAEPWSPWYGDDSYGWDSYGGPAVPPPRGGGRGGGGGGYRGRFGNGAGGPYRGYEAAAPPSRPAPYDYHGRSGYGAEPAMGYGGGGYDSYGYQAHPVPYGAPEENYNKIFMRGLPFRVTGQQIMDFFAPLNCVEIKLGYLPDGRTSGDGYVEFASPEEAFEAKQKDRQSINNR